MRPVTEGRVRVLIETLRLIKLTETVELENIASSAKTTESFARKVLVEALGETDDTWISVSPIRRRMPRGGRVSSREEREGEGRGASMADRSCRISRRTGHRDRL